MSEAKFLEKRKTDKHGCWIVELLCKHQAESIERFKKLSMAQRENYSWPPIFFKWKPFIAMEHMPAAQAGIKWLAQNDHVKVVFNERNPLDTYASSLRHKNENHLPAACKAGDVACLEEFKTASDQLELELDSLTQGLQYTINMVEVGRRMLNKMNVSYVSVQYEKLFYGDSAAEWNKLLDFINVKPLFEDISMDTIKKVAKLADTSGHDRSKTIANYDQVVEALTGTKYEKYLGD